MNQIRYLSSLSKSVFIEKHIMKRRAFLKSSLLAGAGVGFNHSAQSAVSSLSEQNNEQKEIILQLPVVRPDVPVC